MRISKSNHSGAFTLVEGVLVLATVSLLLATFLTVLRRAKAPGQLSCVNRLVQVGVAFRIWEGDHGDKYPMAVSVAQGGAQELIATGNVAACFQVMSNELATPKILVCPEDSEHSPATNFDIGFSRTNISYFIGLGASENNLQTVLSGDDNLVLNGRIVPPGILNLWTHNPKWTSNRHHGTGNVLLADGSVQSATSFVFTSSAGACFATNSVVIP